MQKMSVSVPDSTMNGIDAEVNHRGGSRSHFVADAIDFYIGTGRNLENEINRLNEELMIKTAEAKSLSEKVLQLEESIPTIENQLAEAHKELNSKTAEVFQKDKKIRTMENQIVELQKKIESLSKEVLLAKEDGMKAREELEKTRSEVAKYEMAIQLKDKQISFLESTVHQALEKITPQLPPSQEEAKKKGWWKFWKIGRAHV
jgi:chromosome segregation ATPase